MSKYGTIVNFMMILLYCAKYNTALSAQLLYLKLSEHGALVLCASSFRDLALMLW